MNIVSIGRRFPLKEVRHFDFRSEYTLLDYDLVLWDPGTLLYEYSSDGRYSRYRGYLSLNSHDSVSIIEDRERRKAELVDLIKLGRTVVMFVPTPTKFYIDTGQRSFSGTGRNQKTTIHVSEVSLRSFIPISGEFNTVEAIGTQIDFRGDDPFKSFWKRNKENMYYKAYLTHLIGQPFLFVYSTNRIVGSRIRYERGNLLLLPNLTEEEDFARKSDYTEANKIFIESLIELVSSLQKETGNFSLPKWTLNYKLPDEETLEQELTSLRAEAKGIAELIEAKRSEISALEKYKLLLSAKGHALHRQVISVLQELGIDTKEGPAGRDDIIMTFEGMTGIAEVKGTNKSAAEAHAAQLEKWVSEYFTEHGVKPKGFLIVNPFHDIPLSMRTEEPFPHQMLKYCINREHCLLTTSQLLGILLTTRTSPDKRLDIIRNLFSTVGVFRGFEDFSSFVRVTESAGVEIKEVAAPITEQLEKAE